MGKHQWLIVLVILFLGLGLKHVTAEEEGAHGEKKSTRSSMKIGKSRIDHGSAKAMTDADIQQRQYMIEISRQLGVTCTYCHDIKDFKVADKAAYKISKTHIEVVKTLNEKYSGQIGEKVDCYMCHHGQTKPSYKEKLETHE